MTLENQNSRFGKRTSFEVPCPTQIEVDDYIYYNPYPQAMNRKPNQAGSISNTHDMAGGVGLAKGWLAHGGRAFWHWAFCYYCFPPQPLSHSLFEPYLSNVLRRLPIK
jgi:hypothetical protein